MRFEKISLEEAMGCCPALHGYEAEEALEWLRLPIRSTANSAGYDFFSPFDVKAKAGETVSVPLLVKLSVSEDEPKNFVLLIFNRSGLSLKQGLRLDNAVGVVDADYRQCIWFQATATKDIEIAKGQRICQGVFMPFLVVDGDEAIGERNGGFGSTGR